MRAFAAVGVEHGGRACGFTLISGRMVHEGENAQQILVRAATTAARSLTTVAFDVPAEVADLVARALAFDKAGRWPSAAAMRDAVAAAHESRFGEAPSRRPLAMLSSGLAVAATAVVDGVPVKAAAVSERVDAPLGFATTAVSTGASSVVARSPVAITPAPVSGRPTPAVVQVRPGRPRVRVAARLGAAAAFLALGGAGIFSLRTTGQTDRTPETSGATAPRGPGVASERTTAAPSVTALSAVAIAPVTPAVVTVTPQAQRPDPASPLQAMPPRAATRSQQTTAAPAPSPPVAPSRAASEAGSAKPVAAPRNPLDMVLK